MVEDLARAGPVKVLQGEVVVLEDLILGSEDFGEILRHRKMKNICWKITKVGWKQDWRKLIKDSRE
jgi:hypothetical protein